MPGQSPNTLDSHGRSVDNINLKNTNNSCDFNTENHSQTKNLVPQSLLRRRPGSCFTQQMLQPNHDATTHASKIPVIKSRNEIREDCDKKVATAVEFLIGNDLNSVQHHCKDQRETAIAKLNEEDWEIIEPEIEEANWTLV